MEARTENLSSQGFYCIAKEPFPVGERLDCELAFPPQWGARNEEASVSLRCVAQVVRVESNHQHEGFGIACRIEDYAFRRPGYGAVGLPVGAAP